MKHYVIWADKTGKMMWVQAFYDNKEANAFAEKEGVPCIIVSSESPINVNTYYAG